MEKWTKERWKQKTKEKDKEKEREKENEKERGNSTKSNWQIERNKKCLWRKSRKVVEHFKSKDKKDLDILEKENKEEREREYDKR